jgi:hypothetical protein
MKVAIGIHHSSAAALKRRRGNMMMMKENAHMIEAIREAKEQPREPSTSAPAPKPRKDVA